MRGLWIAFASLVMAAGICTATGQSAEADDCCCSSGGSYRRSCAPRGRVGCGAGRGYGYRSARGGSWRALRRGLGQGSFYDPTRRWVRDHYLTRFRFRHIAGEEALRMRVLLSDDLLAVMSEEQGKEAVLDVNTRLDRASARFFVADYDGARTDLNAVLAAEPSETRARWGLLLCAVCKNEWDAAGQELGLLAKAGELQPGDRVDAERVFADPKVFPSIVRGLRTYADMKITDGTVHVVTAWALSSQGDGGLAKRYLRMAKRWGADATTTTALAQAFAGKTAAPAGETTDSNATERRVPAPKKAKAAPQQPAPKKQGRLDPPEDEIRAPAEPALHRQMAKAKPPTRMAAR